MRMLWNSVRGGVGQARLAVDESEPPSPHGRQAAFITRNGAIDKEVMRHARKISVAAAMPPR